MIHPEKRRAALAEIAQANAQNAKSPIIHTLLKLRIIDGLKLELTALQEEQLDEPANNLCRNQQAEIKNLIEYLDQQKNLLTIEEQWHEDTPPEDGCYLVEAENIPYKNSIYLVAEWDSTVSPSSSSSSTLVDWYSARVALIPLE